MADKQCRTCDDLLAADFLDEDGACIACRVQDAARYDKSNMETRRGLFEAERFLLQFIVSDRYPAEEKPMYNGIDLRLALNGVRKAHG